MEAGEYGLTRGARFIAVYLDMVTVAGLMWVSSCIFGGAGYFLFFCSFFSFERTRSAASTRPPCLMYLSTSTGVRTGCHYLISLRVCVLVVFTDCESCTRRISTNPGSMEAGEYGLTRGTCFVARRLDVVAVAGLLWTSWCVLGAAGFISFFFPTLFFLRTHTACCKYEPPLPQLPLY